ncbi:STAS/SEC14 domain-containing protein [Hymenobacter canadensis]|uniref:STAS/SEC14 domain-containing protein n=1 Tax=Hymenobacter canadensis TaxID=2999067 RepID=A0ABY7LXZ4_9BACT|nr:STAS/SEC14 domain-containing protein [Hymenobacter canadensis]WBA44140.1 STAS/SEC14 domain-containing protein [Hymenobacter canadensis]
MEILFTTDCLRVQWHAATGTLEMAWQCFASGDEFRQAVSTTLDLARQHGARNWLSDNRLMRAIRVADQEWYSTALHAPLLALGLRRMAVVESEDAMNRMAVNGLLRQHANTFTFELRQFATLEEARTWLRSE